MTIKQKQWQRYDLGYYGGRIHGAWGTQTIAKSTEMNQAIQKVITDVAWQQSKLNCATAECCVRSCRDLIR